MKNIFENYKIFDIDPSKLRSKNFYRDFVVGERTRFWEERKIFNKSDDDSCCFLCGNRESNRSFLQYREYRLLECDQCHLVFANIRIDEQYEKMIYDTRCYEDVTKREVIDSYEYRKNTFGKERFEYIENIMTLTKKSKLLDVGCGPGYFLKYAHDQGVIVKGLEITPFLVSLCKKQGLNVEKASLEDEPDGEYDVITLFDVLEHLSEPVSFVRQVNLKLLDNGIMVMYMPNIHSFAFYFQGNRQNLLQPYEHLCFYNKSSLDWLARQCSFEVVSVEFFGLDVIDYFTMKEYEDGVEYNKNLQEIIPYLQALVDVSNISNHMRVVFKKQCNT